MSIEARVEQLRRLNNAYAERLQNVRHHLQSKKHVRVASVIKQLQQAFPGAYGVAWACEWLVAQSCISSHLMQVPEANMA